MKPFLCGLILLFLSLNSLMAQDEEFIAVSVSDFETLSDDSGDRIGQSMSESLSEALSMVSGIKLYERSQLERLTGELQMEIESSSLFDQETLQQVGKMVSIDYYVLGSVSRIADQVRITARITEILTGKVILSTRIEGAYLDMFDLQDELAYRVIEALNVSMSDMEKQRIEERRPKKLESFEIYNVALSEQDLQARKELLQNARAMDPDYMMISQYLADTYLELGEGANAAFLYKDLLSKDPENYSVSYNLAILLFDQNRVFEARDAFQRCVEMRPDDADALFNLGLLYEMGDDGSRLGPGSDLGKAADYYQQVLQISPHYPNALYALGLINIMWAQCEQDPQRQKEEIDASISYLETYLEIMPHAFNAEEVKQNLEIFRGVQSQLVEMLAP